MQTDKIVKIPILVKELYKIVDELEECFPDRYFTLDGHLVGSIGEVLASYYYNLKLLPPSSETHDAVSQDGKLIQIKTTQINKVALSSNPEYLLVIKLLNDGSFDEIYNGPGELVWNRTGKMQKNGQKYILLSTLALLMKDVSEDMRINRFK